MTSNAVRVTMLMYAAVVLSKSAVHVTGWSWKTHWQIKIQLTAESFSVQMASVLKRTLLWQGMACQPGVISHIDA